jgi:hypothetical protein
MNANKKQIGLGLFAVGAAVFAYGYISDANLPRLLGLAIALAGGAVVTRSRK